MPEYQICSTATRPFLLTYRVVGCSSSMVSETILNKLF